MRLLAALLFVLVARPALAQAFTLTDLGLPPGYTSSSAKAVNDKGQVTGEISHGTRFSYAFLYSGGRIMDLGTLPGFTDSVGNAINDRSEVAGVATRPDPAPDSVLTVHAFTAKAGLLQDLRPDGKALYLSSGINAAGSVVGGVITLRDQDRAFVFRNDRLVVLDELAVGAAGWELQEADAINDAGDIVGSGTHGGPRAFLLRGGVVTDLNRFLPAPAEWVMERATGINNRGDVVCIGKRGAASHAFLLSGGLMADLGELGGYPNIVEAHLNNAGQVVGTAEAASGTAQCAFLYDQGRLTDLNRCLPAGAHWSLTEANGINDTGVIVGAGEHEGRGRAFLLTPKDGDGKEGRKSGGRARTCQHHGDQSSNDRAAQDRATE